MVKVNDKRGDAVSPGNGPVSVEGDGSFVVLERDTLQDYNRSQFPNGAHPHLPQAPFDSPSIMNQTRETPTSSFIPGSLPDLSPEEIQRKLQEVLQENVELKETLHQNNLAMKQQFNTLVMWQDEVFKVHQSHKEKFQETKELILKLKAENTELKNYLEKCGSSSDTQLKAENAKLKGQIAELQQKLSAPMPRRDHPAGAPTKKEEELTDLVKQLNTQLETAERARRQLTIEVESLGARRIRAERESADLKVALAEQTRKCVEMEKKNVELVQKVEQCEQEMRSYVMVEKKDGSSRTSDSLVAQLEAAHSQVKDLRKKVADEEEIKSQLITQLQSQEQFLQELQKKMQLQQQQLEQLQSPPKQAQPSLGKEEEGFKSLLHLCEERIRELNSILFRQTERYANLDKWLRNTAAHVRPWQPSHSGDAQNVTSLRAEIEQLMKLLAQEEAYSREMKTHLAENENNFQKLFADYQVLLSEWENFHQEQKDKDRHNADYHSVQTRGFSEKLDNLVAQVLCKEEEIKENEKEIKELKEKIKKLELENEAITILKAQVEVYQSDFNAEREARQNLAGEKERLAEDLRHLQRRNQQLLDEMEAYQRNQFDQGRNTGGSNWGTIAAPGRVSANASLNAPTNAPAPLEPSQRRSPEIEPSPPRSAEESQPIYYCPKCQKGFKLLQPLQFHVEMCLELSP
ncbi:hypothetical protein R5R35_004867 [Gryllus longicercus]|uniref:CCHC NOA-type domain-containing protein n=1 Tax=Gryllus longicercus TaxID=2509291 RepID=A0AAN9V9Q9_9ORTH